VWNLDDDLSLELAVPGKIDGAHPSAVEGLPDLVAIVEELADEPVLCILCFAVYGVAQARSSS
jgi:hypothetical protein